MSWNWLADEPVTFQAARHRTNVLLQAQRNILRKAALSEFHCGAANR
jgi:hypothetical protein